MPKVVKEKSAKKLSDISNVAKNPPSGKKKSEKNDVPIERLIHTDLTNIIRQIEVLQVHVAKVKTNTNLRSHDIESFKCVLSDARASFQPWLMRFHAPCLGQSTSLGNQSIQHLTETLFCKESDITSPRSPQKIGMGTSVSPSPLVSWHAEYQAENRRQLFLLTPLPRTKVLSFKCQDFSASALKHPGKIDHPMSLSSVPKSCHDHRSQKVAAAPGETVHGMVETVAVNYEKASNVFPNSACMNVNCSQSGVPLKAKLSSNQKHRNATYLMTPCLKMSPPKTCLLLEQISETCATEQNNPPPESTSLTVRVLQFDESHSPEHSDEDISKILASKYPAMYGLRIASKAACTKKEVEASPDHFISPPKTCILLAPSPSVSKRSVIDVAGHHKAVMTNLVSEMNKEDHGQVQLCEGLLDDVSVNMAIPEGTPRSLGKAANSGKAAGEQTLKRELWAKFEAVSVRSSQLTINCLVETTPVQFLHRLEDVFSEEQNRASKTKGTNL